MRNNSDVRVLIAEDDYLVSEMIKGLLKEATYSVIGEATSGREAIQLAQSLRPDVILMDIKMPDLDGIEATQQISESCPTPVVVLTAYETRELVARASLAGVGAYLVKPANASEIERAITVAMARFDDLVELRRLNAALQERNAELDAFAHTVAHDIKSQLAPLIGFAELLEMDCAATLGPSGLSTVYKILEMGHKMSNIVDELLLLAQVRATNVPSEPLDMARWVAAARGRLSHLIEERKAELILPETWPTALGHGPWIEEVWVNYLSNGLKYGGRPELGIAPHLEMGACLDQAHMPTDPATEPEMVRFWIKDNGPGISPSDQSQLFIPFTHIHQTAVRGHGLGLSIVRRIVEKSGGQVGVESEVGKGSTFWFTLPLA
jgi:two-component system sensor histidine kinase/response regulator